MSKSIPQFESLFKAHHKGMCGLSYTITHDREIAQDLVQEVFLKLWSGRTQFSEISYIKKYLYKAITNASIRHMKTVKHTLSIEDNEHKHYEDPKSIAEEKELEEKIRIALDSLPPKCKAVFVLSRFEEMSYQEIAEHLGISVKTVKNQMLIALSRMRNDLKPYLTKEFLGLMLISSICLISSLLIQS